MRDRIKFYLFQERENLLPGKKKMDLVKGYDRGTRTLSVFNFLALKSSNMVILNWINKCERCDNKAIVHTAPGTG